MNKDDEEKQDFDKYTETIYEHLDSRIELLHSKLMQQTAYNCKEILDLILVSIFDMKLMQLMLKDIYCSDKKSTARYNNLRQAAAEEMQKQYKTLKAAETMNLQKVIDGLRNENKVLKAKVELILRRRKCKPKLTTSTLRIIK